MADGERTILGIVNFALGAVAVLASLSVSFNSRMIMAIRLAPPFLFGIPFLIVGLVLLKDTSQSFFRSLIYLYWLFIGLYTIFFFWALVGNIGGFGEMLFYVLPLTFPFLIVAAITLYHLHKIK
jgi:hypothetical protein